MLPVLCQLWLAAGISQAEPGRLDFSLPAWGGEGGLVSLDDFKGGIVVLDFFAYWCVPCQKASAQIETGVRQYYTKLGGNPNGVPVTVLAINIDDSKPDKVAQFVKNAGFERVLNDSDGGVFKNYGGTGVPFVVVVSMVGGKPQIIHQSAGFKGVETLRAAIDSVAAPPARGTPQGQGPAFETPPPDAPVGRLSEPEGLDGFASPDNLTVHDLALSSALLVTSDIQLTDSVLEYNARHPRRRITPSLQHGFIGLDFVPAANQFYLTENRVEAQRIGGSLIARLPISDSWQWTVGGGGRWGYADYQSLWLSEYYKQTYNFYRDLLSEFADVPEYEAVQPWGCYFTTDLRWEYLPACGFLTASFSYQYDIVSPAYTFTPFPARENDRFETIGGGIGLENILTPRVRTQLDIRVGQTTGRRPRGTLRGALNYAVAESLVWRTEAAGSIEEPSLRAWSVGTTLEKDWDNTWFLSLTGRYYQDTGEFEESLPGNATAPAVRTFQGLLSLRWQGKSSSLRISAGPYFNQYLEPPSDPSFTPLYQDRDWFHVNVAYMYAF